MEIQKVKKMGRPTKFNADRCRRIVVALRAGNTREASVAHGAIDYQTFLNWMEQGRQAKSGQKFDFFEAVKQAEADSEVANVAIIRQAANSGTWQAAAWWLERRRPNDYRKIERVENTGIDGQPQQVEHIVTWKIKPSPPEELSNMNGGNHIQSNGNLLKRLPSGE